MENLLTFITFIPLLGALLILLIPKDDERTIKNLAVGISFVPLLLAIYLWFAYNKVQGGFQFEVLAQWIPAIAPASGTSTVRSCSRNILVQDATVTVMLDTLSVVPEAAVVGLGAQAKANTVIRVRTITTLKNLDRNIGYSSSSNVIGLGAGYYTRCPYSSRFLGERNAFLRV